MGHPATSCANLAAAGIRTAGTFMKTTLYVLLVFVLGAGFGFFFALPSAVHAGIRVVRVTRLHLTMGTGAVPVDGPVVGFTCSPNPDGTADCFIASQP
jgi:hypothetical protein